MPSLPSLEAFAKGTFATVAGVTTLGCGLLYYGQNYLIYPSAFPPGSRTEVQVPTDFGLEYQDLPLVTEDGLTLRCYLLTQRTEISNNQAAHIEYADHQTHEEFASTRPTVVMFHGNGGNHGHRIPLAKVFYVKMRCNVLMLSYRGYGHSEGSPSETGIRIDAQTALNYLNSHPYLQNTPVILYGQSIGGAVAIDLASRNPSKIAALILENTFTTLPRLVPKALPLLGPLSFLCHQKWDSASKIPLIPRSTPILMLSGVRDEVVPREHMQELWQIISRRQGAKLGTGNKSDVTEVGNGKSKFIEFEGGYHNDTCVQHGYWTAVADFVANLSRL
ncbi:Alpha/Beta hydrolase protein [Suillus clintonianus]|uniref:Alpha/Beta hydrolase protein n=1 Tax=Suillus clintonianus TaxID=1904413 RepID=UPI001B872048|nr:Alpha/Beta hydrolase protein [Suillus clintonianus]KAG2130902.1 Alpha/Beta hydrolase protein [Suillus clintonianus]